MEEMVFKQGTKAWIGFLEFEKIKGLYGTQRIIVKT